MQQNVLRGAAKKSDSAMKVTQIGRWPHLGLDPGRHDLLLGQRINTRPICFSEAQLLVDTKNIKRI